MSVCGATVNDDAGIAVGCPFAPTHHLVVEVPAGHVYGLPDTASELDLDTCAIHLDVLTGTLAALGLTADVARVPRATEPST